MEYDEIKRISIKETPDTTVQILKISLLDDTPLMVANNIEYAKDITAYAFDRARLALTNSQMDDKVMSEHFDYSAVFIVHGRDDLAKTEVARFVEKLGLNAVVLHEQANEGKTIIEKLEARTDVGFAIVLYTPCDEGNLVGETPKSRARQNVVFEHGYLIGKLGRKNVCALVKGSIETPNDISGVVYTDYDDKGAWKMELAKELREAGYEIDANKII